MQYLLPVIFFLLGPLQASPRVDPRSAAAIVAQIQRADYEGDRAALHRLFEELAPFTEDRTIAARIHYWRGFALWRRALNGFNESAERGDLEGDLRSALAEFQMAVDGPDAADAQSAAASCLQNLAFLHYVQKDAAAARDFLERSFPLLKAAETGEPDNPRVLWVVGASDWYAPPERGGGQQAAIATYAKGLKAARLHNSSGNDPLKPSWGEPELLMNLAWSKAHQASPDLKLAEEYANSALELVPYWHYVRDVLLPQIRAAKKEDKKAAIPLEEKKVMAKGNPVTHFQILAKAPDETAQFYTRLFGWTVNAGNPLQYRQIDTKSSEGIQGGIWPAPPETSNSVQLFVTVEDVQATVKQAEVLGAKLLMGPTTLPEGDEIAILLDPQQMSFGVWKPKRK